jgi:hypothetical protein
MVLCAQASRAKAYNQTQGDDSREPFMNFVQTPCIYKVSQAAARSPTARSPSPSLNLNRTSSTNIDFHRE